MSTYVGNDPFEAAANATLEPRPLYGQLRLVSGFCVLEKGIGRKAFDPTLHSFADRRAEVKLEITPLPEMNMKFPVLREMLSDGVEWVKLVLPSLKTLGITTGEQIKSLDGRWVSAKLIPTGRSYVDKNGNTKDGTTLVLVALYADELACRQAYQAANPAHDNGNGAAAPVAAQAPWAPASTPAPTNGSNPEKEAAWKFAQVFIKQANGDIDALTQKLAGNAVIAKYFSINSPEVVDAIFGAAVPA